MKKGKNAIILCSGGLDSVVTAFYVKNKLHYSNLVFLFFNYNQKSIKSERNASAYFSKFLGAKFLEVYLPSISSFSSSLITKSGNAKKIKREDLKNTKEESKKWYVPCRNLIFFSNALSLAESLMVKENKIYDIFVGFKCEGSDSYPDTTQEFLNSINNISKSFCRYPFRIFAPIIKKDKEDIVQLGLSLKIPLEKTFSCYVGKKNHCGTCLACMLRKEGFYWANIKDNTKYTSR